LAGSRWAVERHGRRQGTLSALDAPAHQRLVDLVCGLVATGVAGGESLCQGVHDVSAGGLAVALAEMAVRAGIGMVIDGIADHAELFTEMPSRIVVATDRPDELCAAAAAASVPAAVLGRAAGERLIVEGLVDLSVQELTSRAAASVAGALGEDR
jgi:phosphoribosylformylglycinamidine synthase